MNLNEFRNYNISLTGVFDLETFTMTPGKHTGLWRKAEKCGETKRVSD